MILSRHRAAHAAFCAAALLALVACSADTFSTADLATARKDFQTHIVADTLKTDGPADAPPPAIFQRVHYPSGVGPLVAYVTPDPKDGRKHPAVIWAHGGYGGIGSFFWQRQSPSNDQSARAFREAGLVLMTPSWRGENDNPGRFEMFYGEVDDLLAAREYLAHLPYVDPARIYLAGHSTGGTMALLAAETGRGFRAVFSLGGVADLERRLAAGPTSAAAPFDTRSTQELRLRSPIFWLAGLKAPTFYFEGQEQWTGQEALHMIRPAEQAHAPLQVFLIPGADHFQPVLPITRLIAAKILQDDGPTVSISISHADVQGAMVSLAR